MSSRSLEPTVRQSVLDRLIDLEPQLRADPPANWSDSVRKLRAAVMRDVEWLLNTRRIIHAAPDHMPQLAASVYNYGLEDITSRSRDSEDTRTQLARQIEECISQFEPRLTSVRVIVREDDSDSAQRIRFSIDALLRMEPDPERILFDTVLEVTSGEFQIAGTHA
ncbi:MAG: type VI secretion system baseplate subunit TssE [Longimicrobiales bacterium]